MVPALVILQAAIMEEQRRSKGNSSREYIDQLPVIVAKENQDIICPICLDEIEARRRLKVLECGHVFHNRCISMWLYQNYRCPTCRAPMPKVNRSPEKKRKIKLWNFKITFWKF